MKKISIVNPAAGQGDAAKFLLSDSDSEVYITKYPSDAQTFVYDTCIREPETHFFIYGGDGTINEVVNGIMDAGAQKTAVISVIPVGTGNDLIRSFEKCSQIHTLDVIRYNDSYAINMLNVGFDCTAAKYACVLKTKPFISGTGAYIAGVLNTLVNGYGQKMNFRIEKENGESEEISGEFLLCAIANCSYYGGGFHASPAAKYNDGLLDVLLVNKVSRAAFLKMVLDYKNGKHIDHITGRANPKFAKILKTFRCRKMYVSGINDLCVDGEIQPAKSVEISVIPNQIRLKI